MKKILLSAFALMAAMSMNAQEVCVFNADNALGLDADNGTALTAGTVIGETESIVATVGADDTYKPQSATFTVNGQEIKGGLQGGTNPKDADGGTPATTLVQPASGAYLLFEAKADGFLYVMHKASSNKAYSVFEEGVAISYTFAAIGDAATDLGAVYQFTLPYEVENEQFVVKETIGWAEQEFLKAAKPEKYSDHITQDAEGKEVWEAIKVNGLGVIKFPVYKDCKYIVNANGSKITAAGFAFSTEDNVLVQSDEVVIYKGEGAAEPPVVGNGVAVVFNPENVLALDADNGTTLAAGTVIGECDEIVATVGADDTYKPQSVKATAAGYEINGGLQGGTNPKDADGGVPSTTLVQPAAGAFLQFEAKTDGYLYVIHKASSNKAYTVFEEGTAISYTFAAIGDATTDLGAVYQFTLPYEVENEQLVVKESIGWAEQEFLKITAPDTYAAHMTQDTEGKDVWTPIKVNGLGVIKFPVYKDCKYIVNANGSKLTAGGFYFDTTGDATITATVDEAEVTIISGTTTAINASKFFKADNNSGAIYNLAGQKVNASYKGVVIKNGKKFVQK